MHSAVMQNKKYIKFAESNTVEVIALGSLEKGVDAKDRKAERYLGERDGVEVELMVEYPNLTLEEMLALNTSPAGQFNKTGKIPYTSIVDPHTEQELQGFNGGSGGMIMDAVEAAQKKLDQEHGKPVVTRKMLAKLKDAEADASALTGSGEYAQALSALDAAVPANAQLPEVLTKRVAGARAAVIAAAKKNLDEIEALVADDPRKAKYDLTRLQSRLKGTGLEERAAELKSAL